MLDPRRFGRSSLTVWCVIAAFGTYFCTYAFRRPFTAAEFADINLWGLTYKVVLVISQVFGYMASKFIGIKVVSELPASRRIVLLLGLIGLAELAWVLFAITPQPWNLVWAMANGLPLGMIFGLVLGFLEGRVNTEALTAGLCASFVVADGVTRSVGGYLLNWGVDQFWMPACAGLLFTLPLLLFVWMLSRIPPPNDHDTASRSPREPMTREDRWQFFRRYSFGLVVIVTSYLLVTILRSTRSDFSREIWFGLLNESAAPKMFAWSEMIVGLLVILVYGSVVFITDHRRAFFTALMIAASGTVMVMLALVGLSAGWLSPLWFMVMHGLGLYLPYIAVHTTLFERLIAMTRDRGNLGYLMYLADAFGYLGYVLILLVRNFTASPDNFLPFFVMLSWIIAIVCLLLIVPCAVYFARHPATQRPMEGM